MRVSRLAILVTGACAVTLRQAPLLSEKSRANNPYAAAMAADAGSGSVPGSAGSAGSVGSMGSMGSMGSVGSYSAPFSMPMWGSIPLPIVGPLPNFAWGLAPKPTGQVVGVGSGPGSAGSVSEGDPMCLELTAKAAADFADSFDGCSDYRYYSRGGWTDGMPLPSNGCYCTSKTATCPYETCAGTDAFNTCLSESAVLLGLESFQKMTITVPTSGTKPIVSTGCIYLKKFQPQLPILPEDGGSGSGSAPGSGSAAGSGSTAGSR